MSTDWKSAAADLFTTNPQLTDAEIAAIVKAPGLTREARRKRVQRFRQQFIDSPAAVEQIPRRSGPLDAIQIAASYLFQDSTPPTDTKPDAPPSKQRGYPREDFGLDADGPRQFIKVYVPFQKPKWVEVGRRSEPDSAWTFYRKQ